MVERGSHEAVVWGLIGEGGIPQTELFNAAGFNVILLVTSSVIYRSIGPAGKVGFSKAMSAGWITLDKTAKPPLVKKKVDSIEDNVQVTISTKFCENILVLELLNGAGSTQISEITSSSGSPFGTSLWECISSG